MAEISLVYGYEGGARCDMSPAIAAFLTHNGVGSVVVAAAQAGRCYKRGSPPRERQRKHEKHGDFPAPETDFDRLGVELVMVRVAVGLACCLISSRVGSAQSVDLETVLREYYGARGGEKRIESVDAARFVGSVWMGDEIEGSFVLVFKRPGKTRLELTVDGRVGVQVFDGSTAWAMFPLDGDAAATLLGEDRTKLMAEQADLEGPLVDWQAKGHRLQLQGIEDLDSGPAYSIDVTLETGAVRHFYLDVTTMLTVRQTGLWKVDGDEVAFETRLGDYHEVDGLMFPHLVETRTRGATSSQRFVVERVELEPHLADDLFAPPASP
ncbi:MAG: hypothetical protein P8Y44_10925 [Acidobacteriota bacterium]